MNNEPVDYPPLQAGGIIENNKPVAFWNKDFDLWEENAIQTHKADGWNIPLYTHPVKELHLSLQKSKQTGELLAVTYTDDEHRIVEVLWQRPPVKELTDEDRSMLIRTLKWAEDLLREAGHDEAVSDVQDCLMILRKAQEK